MPIREEPWTHGTPSLLSLACPDPRTSAELYANLFGWDLTEGAEPVVATVEDLPVAIFFPAPKITTAGWTTHVCVDDIYVAMATARNAGGTMSDPIELAGHGRIAIGTDPTGALVGYWEPARPESVVGHPGTLLWSELLVRDVEAAVRYYDLVLDYRCEPVDEAGSYLLLHTRDGELVAGLSAIGEDFPADIPAHWMPYVDVEEIVEAYTMAGLLGAEGVMEPTESDFGRIAVLRGPSGEVFGIMEVPLEESGEDEDAAEVA